jgi:hypothetical protein
MPGFRSAQWYVLGEFMGRGNDWVGVDMLFAEMRCWRVFG